MAHQNYAQILHDHLSGGGILNVPVAAHVQNAESLMRAFL